MRFAVVVALLVSLSACVTQTEHERALQDAAARMQVAQQQAGQQIALRDQNIATLQAELARLQKEIDDRDHVITDERAQLASLQRKLDDSTALNRELARELEKAGKGVDALVAERGSLRQALDDTKARLEELRKAQEAAQKRADLFKNLLLKFKKMIDAGNLSIVLRDGRMVLQLRNDVLFDSGKTTIKSEGKAALKDVAGVLVTFTDRHLQVAGHTDNVPIASTRFPSNWELSAARAIAVVKLLVEEGVQPGLLSAAGYGEFDPVASNDSDDGRARNRRIEIVLQPDISELIQVPVGD